MAKGGHVLLEDLIHSRTRRLKEPALLRMGVRPASGGVVCRQPVAGERLQGQHRQAMGDDGTQEVRTVPRMCPFRSRLKLAVLLWPRCVSMPTSWERFVCQGTLVFVSTRARACDDLAILPAEKTRTVVIGDLWDKIGSYHEFFAP